MSEWNLKTLGSMCVKIGSGATPTGGQESYIDEGISLIRSQNVDDHQFLYDGLAHINDDQANKLNNVTVEANDTLINITGDSVARVCSVPINILPARVNQHVAIIRTDGKQLDNCFIKYSLLSMKEHLLSISEIGATRRALTKSMLDNLEILTPNIKEQKAIASVLSSLDDKINLLHQQNKTLEAMAETLFRQWFVEEVGDDWEEGDISYYASHLKTSIQPQNNPQIEYFHYSIPSFDKKKQPVKESGSEIQSNKYCLEKNCILFSKLNPHKEKRIWLLQKEVEENSICSTEFQVIKPYNIKYLYYLYGLLSYKQNYLEIASSVGGTSGIHQRIDPATIFSYICPIVPLKIIENYNEHIIPLFKKIYINQAQIQTLEIFRDTLLPKLMSGEVRVEI